MAERPGQQRGNAYYGTDKFNPEKLVYSFAKIDPLDEYDDAPPPPVHYSKRGSGSGGRMTERSAPQRGNSKYQSDFQTSSTSSCTR